MYYATLKYLRKALRNLVKWAEAENVKSIGLPKIGAGLGKLSWEIDVKPIMKEYLSTSTCRFIIYEHYKCHNESFDA